MVIYSRLNTIYHNIRYNPLRLDKMFPNHCSQNEAECISSMQRQTMLALPSLILLLYLLDWITQRVSVGAAHTLERRQRSVSEQQRGHKHHIIRGFDVLSFLYARKLGMNMDELFFVSDQSVTVALNGHKYVSSFSIFQCVEFSRASGKAYSKKGVWCEETPARLTHNSPVNSVLFSEKDKGKQVRGWKRAKTFGGFSQTVRLDWVVRELGEGGSG